MLIAYLLHVLYSLCMTNEPIGVVEGRARFSSLLDRAAAGEDITLGRRNTPEVIMTSYSTFNSAAPPQHIEAKLLAGFANSEADFILGTTKPFTKGQAIHPGDPVGSVVAWLWRSDPDKMVLFLGDLMARLRIHSPLAPTTNRPRLSDLLDGLGFALPNDFTKTEYKNLVATAKAQVPAVYSLTESPDAP